MPIEVHDASAGELRPQPGKAEIDAVELQNCPPYGTIDKYLDIPLQPGIPSSLVHVELPPNPVLFVAITQLFQSVILTPIIVDLLVALISVFTACILIEPPSFVKRLIIRS